MEFYREMNISAEALFDTLTRSVLFDIKEQTGNSIDPNKLSHFEYVKRFNKNQQATIQIERFEKNKSYHYRTKTTKNNFLAKYDIIPKSSESCELHYTEEIESHGYMQKLNDMLIGTLLNRFKKKKFIEMLKQIESSEREYKR